MKKLKVILENWIYNGKIEKGCSPADMNLLLELYTEKMKGGKPQFIQMNCKRVLEKCGFIISPYGIGFIWL
jgi:hypothetical protein